MDSGNVIEEQLYKDVQELEEIRATSFMQAPKARIQLRHSLFPANIIIPILEETPEQLKSNVDKIIKEIKASKIDLAREHIRSLPQIYQPQTINDTIWFFKLGTMEFFIKESTTESNFSMLNYNFEIRVDFGNNPLHLHLITKEVLELECFKNSKRNKIYYAKIMCNRSQLGFYLSVCIVWDVLFSSVDCKSEMYRFHKFSEIIAIIKKIDLKKFENKEDLYFVLECISFLLNIITRPNIMDKVDSCYVDYFKYNNDDITALKNWCIATNRNFHVTASDGEIGNLDNSLISDMLELDILIVLENLETSEE